jgi:hypothetical protein
MTEVTSAQAIFKQNPDVVGAEVSGEMILLNTKTSVYLEIDDIGARIWALMETPRSFGSLVEELQKEFDVDQAVCTANTDAFVRYLAESGFLAAGEPA